MSENKYKLSENGKPKSYIALKLINKTLTTLDFLFKHGGLMKTKSITILLGTLLLLTQGCGGGGSEAGGNGGGPGGGGPVTFSHLFYTDCVDEFCTDGTLYEYAPESNTHTRVDSTGFAINGANHSLSKTSIVVDGKLYYRGKLASRPNFELLVYDPLMPKVTGVNPRAVYEGTGGTDVAVANPLGFTLHGSKLYFSASSTSASGTELYVFDTTLPGSATNPQVIEIFPGASTSSAPESLTVYNDKIFFKAYLPSMGYELWAYDPSQSLTYLVNPKPLETITGSSTGHFGTNIVHNNKLYFPCAFGVGNFGVELCVYDDQVGYTANGGNPSLGVDIAPGSIDSYPRQMASIGNKLVFAAQTTATGWELMILDTNAAPSVSNPQILDLNPGAAAGIEAYGFAVEGNKYFFNGDNGNSGNELFAMDVSAPQSSTNPQLIELAPGNDGANPLSISSCLNGSVCFRAEEPNSGQTYLVTIPASQTSLSYTDPGVQPSVGLTNGDPSAFTTFTWTVQ